MKKNLTIQALLIVCLWANLAFAGSIEKPEISDLTPWIGHSVSIIKLYQRESANKYFSEVTKYAPKGYTPELVKEFIYNQFALKFKSIDIVDKDTIVIDHRISGKYTYIGKLTTKWKKLTATWEIFKTDSTKMIEAGFKYFLFFPFHQHGKDSLRHAHLRYGNETFDFLTTDPSVQKWWPTIYQPATTNEAKVMESMIHMAKLQASMLPPLEPLNKNATKKQEKRN